MIAPDSQGRTPGGARQLRHSRRAVDHSDTRRGENAEQPSATIAAESPHKRGAAPPAGRAGSGEGGAGAPATGEGGQGDSGDVVTGTLVGAGPSGFGAPGLRGAGSGSGGGPATSLAIGAAVLLCGLGGVRLENRRGAALS